MFASPDVAAGSATCRTTTLSESRKRGEEEAHLLESSVANDAVRIGRPWTELGAHKLFVLVGVGQVGEGCFRNEIAFEGERRRCILNLACAASENSQDELLPLRLRHAAVLVEDGLPGNAVAGRVGHARELDEQALPLVLKHAHAKLSGVLIEFASGTTPPRLGVAAVFSSLPDALVNLVPAAYGES